MANSDWASEAFGPLHRTADETRSDKDRVDASALFVALEDFEVERLHHELEYVNECEACRAWVFGTGLSCETHPPLP